MPQTYRYKLHENYEIVDGEPLIALWPEHKPLAEVLELRDTTIPAVWTGTYQGLPTPPGGTVFLRSWWDQPERRYKAEDTRRQNQTIARWLSWDTATSEDDSAAYSALVVGELLPDYRLALSFVYRERLLFPDLVAKIKDTATRFNRDGKLHGVIIEDKSSGTSAYQTLISSAESWLIPLLTAFMPTTDKVTRAQQASLWCSNGSVLLPHPSPAVPWLMDFEDELFDFPGSIYRDQVDAFSQLILWTENLLAEGWRARNAVS